MTKKKHQKSVVKKSQKIKKSDKKEKEKKEKKPSLPLSRIWDNNMFMLRLIRKAAPGYMFVDIITTLSWSVLEFFSGAFLLKVVVDSLGRGVPLEQLLLLVGLLFVLHVAVRFARQCIWQLYAPPREYRLNTSIRLLLYEKMRSIELSCYEDPSFYEKYVKAMGEVNDRAFQVLWSLEQFFMQLFSLIANAALLWTIDPWLILFAIIPFLSGFLRAARNKVAVSESNDMKKVDWHINYVQRCFYLNDYAKEMRLTHMPEKILDDYQGTLHEFIRLKKKYGFKLVAMDYFMKISHEVFTILGATLYAVHATLVRGTMSPGDCLVVINSIGTVSGYLNGFISNLTSFQGHALYIENLRLFLDYEPKVRENPTGLVAKPHLIRAEHLSYRYAGAEKDALHDVNLTIAPGEKIALVGKNGSGKTTFVKLLLHMYQPTDGAITLNGEPMDAYTLTSWRANFQPVFQDFHLLGKSVAENVLLRPLASGEDAQAADRARVTEALRQSGALPRVEQMAHGMDSVLTKEFDSHGEVLSGGEAQKVALARVFATEAPFVILDEPTSALDPVAEYTLFENMMQACAQRAVIFISHRLSSAVLADRIYLFDGGTILESGTHAQLMELNGHYATMFHQQAESYVSQETEEVTSL